MDLPSGTVTFLFTDVEDSTRRWQEDPTAMAVALREHDAVLVEEIEARGGAVFKHTGDGVCAVFPTASSTVEAAQAAQSRVALPVRMGAHTGEAERRGDDYFGLTVNRAARVMDAGHGGQLLVSAATAALLDPGIELLDLGTHCLKGITVPERILQVGRAEFPPLRVENRLLGNLPAPASGMVGREEELARTRELLAGHRLVTLTGVGGSGKTRLALAVAEAERPRFGQSRTSSSSP